MNISITVNKLDGLKRSVKINVNKDEYVLQYKKDLDKYKSTVKMDGFRTGKVPENVILKNYKDRIQGDTLNTLIQSSLKQALNEHNLDTASLLYQDYAHLMPALARTVLMYLRYHPEFYLYNSLKLRSLELSQS